MNFNLIDSRTKGVFFKTVLESLFFPFERAFVSMLGGTQEQSECGMKHSVFLHKTHELNLLMWWKFLEDIRVAWASR